MGRVKWRKSLASLLIFLAAFGVRLLFLQDTRGEVDKVQTVVVNDYKRVARLLREGGASSFFDSSSPLADPDNLGHPPGYSILLAFVYGIFGEQDAPVQLLQITLDALCAVLIFLIAAEVLSAGAGLIAGLFAGLAPQFAWNSVLLLPDSLSVFPILLAVYLLAQTLRRPRLMKVLLAGALLGLSCWLRANALLLAPFVALASLLLFERKIRARYSATLLAGAILVIAPLTIRNAIVFHHFIPLSLGAGQTFLEGIADYDREGRFGVPQTDMGIMKWEAENLQRPDYYGSLFNPDGIMRERLRLKRGLSIVASHPVWFAGVMLRRAASMLRLERARTVSTEPPVSHRLEAEEAPAYSTSPAEMKATAALAPNAHASLSENGQSLELTGDDSKYGDEFASAPFELQPDTDYLFTIPAKILRGRMSINIKSDRFTHAFAIIETEEMKSPEEQPEKVLRLTFVSRRSLERARLVISNAASQDANPTIRIGTANLYALGPASNTWTRIPRTLLNLLQKLYLTAVMLPLSTLGLVLLIRARNFRPLILLLIVPAYYLCVQSATHTEYRYVLVIHYFLFALAALFIYAVINKLAGRLRARKLLPQASS
jgi:hypothetical protein